MHHRCEAENCKKHATHGYESDRMLRRCAGHRLKDMVDLVNKRYVWREVYTHRRARDQLA
jgi:hypothetical protein